MNPITNTIISNFSENSRRGFAERSDPEKKEIINKIIKEFHKQCISHHEEADLADVGAKERLCRLASQVLISAEKSLPLPLNASVASIMRLLTSDANWQEGLKNKEVHRGKMLYAIAVQKDPALFRIGLDWIKERLERATVEIEDPKLCEIYYHNLLAYYPFLGPNEGDLLRVPNGPKGALVTYRTERLELTPIGLASPLVAYGLIPIKDNQAPPIFLIKGTTPSADEGSYLSFLTDINPFLPVGGYAFHLCAKARIAAWFEKNRKANHGKSVVVGASLGGALTLQVVSYFPHHICAAHAFNSPAMTDTEVNIWKARVKLLSEAEKPKVHVYLQSGDPISQFVGRRWAEDWEIFHVHAPIKTAFQSHTAAFTSHPKAFVIRGSARVENNKWGRRLWPLIQNGLFVPLFLLSIALLPLFCLVHNVIRLVKKIFPPQRERVSV